MIIFVAGVIDVASLATYPRYADFKPLGYKYLFL